MAEIGVVVPVYWGAGTLPSLHEQLVEVLSSLTEAWEVVYVDDGSPDASWEWIANAAEADARVRGIKLIRNYGEHVAITAGLDAVDADHTMIMACDLQDDPHAIPLLLEKAREGFDLVLARRLHRRDRLVKRVLAWCFYFFIRLFIHVRYDHRVGNFRCVSRRAIQYFRLYPERLRNVNAIMAIMKLPTAHVDVQHQPRHSGQSTYSLFRSTQLGFHVLVAYSELPAQLVVVLGVVIAIGSLVAGGAAWAGWFWSAATRPLAISTAVIGLIGGLTTLAIGTVGIYLTKTFVETRKRPLYFAERRTQGAAGGRPPHEASAP